MQGSIVDRAESLRGKREGEDHDRDDGQRRSGVDPLVAAFSPSLRSVECRLHSSAARQVALLTPGIFDATVAMLSIGCSSRIGKRSSARMRTPPLSFAAFPSDTSDKCFERLTASMIDRRTACSACPEESTVKTYAVSTSLFA